MQMQPSFNSITALYLAYSAHYSNETKGDRTSDSEAFTERSYQTDHQNSNKGDGLRWLL
jgi:hypothetical protein